MASQSISIFLRLSLPLWLLIFAKLILFTSVAVPGLLLAETLHEASLNDNVTIKLLSNSVFVNIKYMHRGFQASKRSDVSQLCD